MLSRVVHLSSMLVAFEEPTALKLIKQYLKFCLSENLSYMYQPILSGHLKPFELLLLIVTKVLSLKKKNFNYITSVYPRASKHKTPSKGG